MLQTNYINLILFSLFLIFTYEQKINSVKVESLSTKTEFNSYKTSEEILLNYYYYFFMEIVSVTLAKNNTEHSNNKFYQTNCYWMLDFLC